jgi:hypothetical protein
MLPVCEDADMRYKLVITSLTSKGENMGNAEFHETSENIIYRAQSTDNIKSILACKYHLNRFLNFTPYLPETAIPTIRFPLIQVNGFEVILLALFLESKQSYVIEEICRFKFPSSLSDIKEGCIQELVNKLGLIEVSLCCISYDVNNVTHVFLS